MLIKKRDRGDLEIEKELEDIREIERKRERDREKKEILSRGSNKPTSANSDAASKEKSKIMSRDASQSVGCSSAEAENKYANSASNTPNIPARSLNQKNKRLPSAKKSTSKTKGQKKPSIVPSIHYGVKM